MFSGELLRYVGEPVILLKVNMINVIGKTDVLFNCFLRTCREMDQWLPRGNGRNLIN